MRNWDDLKYVLALSRFGTMTAAANNLHTNVATVSRRIDRVSDEMQVLLFRKESKLWCATEEARKIISLAEMLEASLAQAVSKLAEDPSGLSGQVKVSGDSYLNAYILAEHIASFHKTYPKLHLLIDFSSSGQSLAFGESDISLRFIRPTEGRLIIKRISTAICGYYQKKGGKAGDDWIGLTDEAGQVPDMKIARRFLGQPPSIQLNDLTGVVTAMEKTGLRGVLPSCLARLHEDLVPVVDKGSFSKHPLYVVYHETRKNDQKVQAVAKWFDKIFPGARNCLCGNCKIH